MTDPRAGAGTPPGPAVRAAALASPGPRGRPEPTAPADSPAVRAGYVDPPPRMGFFTDTSVCIGCKACEVACKEWNGVPDTGFDLLGLSYDNTGALTANSWRHVAFIEQPAGRAAAPAAAGVPVPAALATGAPATGGPAAPADGGASRTRFLGMPGSTPPGCDSTAERTEFRWLMMSDVCKHCTEAACLDVCPTGALFRTEFSTVVVQEEICNGCGYCVSACPYGVIDKRAGDGRAWKCTLCYDRIGAGMTPACAQACPTESIQYGELDELRRRADERLARLHEAGVDSAQLYGHDPGDGVGGDGAFFLLLDEPEVYGLPPDPVVTTRDLPKMWRRAGFAALAMAAAAVTAFVGGRS